ncbi:MAG TPA: ACT domain-containing protein, partial [Gemmataceae bacterium]|nr:ACT domain-containing protein [Gemmataceae bacterium]
MQTTIGCWWQRRTVPLAAPPPFIPPRFAQFWGGVVVQTSKQISVFLENKPGRLANVLLALGREKVNIIALTIMDSHEHNVLRFAVDDVDKARQVLKGLSTPFAETEVLLVELR